MSLIEIFQIDAFTDKVFYGNPAAVCLLDEWLNDELMQAIAVENNLSETAFVIENDEGFHIRWFTPNCEIDLCGHATLAAGFVLFETARAKHSQIQFTSSGGPISIKKLKDSLTLDFPGFETFEAKNEEQIADLVNKEVKAVYDTTLDYLIELYDETAVETAKIDAINLARMDKRGLIITASADNNDYDIYSRCFYPKHQIPEDPVTGSAHCVLAPYWAKKLGKNSFRASQGSVRRGTLHCEYKPESNRVYISGACRWYSKGQLVI